MMALWLLLFARAVLGGTRDCNFVCTGGRCEYSECNEPACPGGACRIYDSLGPSCDGGSCVFVRCSAPSCKGGRCVLCPAM